MNSSETWRKFSEENPPPETISSHKAALKFFCKKQDELGKRIVLITSGGTTVPLEHNTVRFVDNFSAGTRGSASAEYFLDAGYAVIFMHRVKSLEPFIRHINVPELVKSLQITQEKNICPSKIEISKEYVPTLFKHAKRFQEVSRLNLLLKIPFTTISEYLHLLHMVSSILHPIGKKAMMYLAAAVSDFYIPSNDLAVHKISSCKPFELHLQLVPKLLQPLVHCWAPDAFVISFKLETDENILLEKAKKSLETYGHKLVIANLLHNRKEKVVFVAGDWEEEICMSQDELSLGQEIEEKIVRELIYQHDVFIIDPS